MQKVPHELDGTPSPCIIASVCLSVKTRTHVQTMQDAGGKGIRNERSTQSVMCIRASDKQTRMR